MSKKKIGIITALCLVFGGVAFLAMPLDAKKSQKTETKVISAEIKKAPLAPNRVYVMYVDTCPMCKKALDYLNTNKADNPFIERVDLNTEQGKALLKECRQKFGFKDVIIPLICADKEFTMGWSGKNAQKLKELSEQASKNN